MMSKDGQCRSFDHRGAGYARSEGVVAIVITRASAALRPYAQIVNTGVNRCDCVTFFFR